MSRVVKNNQSYLQCLINSPSHQRQVLLETATPEQVHAIVQAAHNICRGSVPLTNQEKEVLTPYKESIKDLEDPSISLKRKKDILIQEGGSFIPDLLLPILTTFLL